MLSLSASLVLLASLASPGGAIRFRSEEGTDIDADTGSPVGGTLVATLGAYPGYTGTAPAGTIAVTETVDGIKLEGVATGLEHSVSGGFHIHEGFSCSASGGHYFDGLSVDPWSTTYASDGTGVASISMSVSGFSIHGTRPVAGRAVVLHNSGGVRIGCGLLQLSTGQVTHMVGYPGSSAPVAMVGTLVTVQTATGVTITGTVGRLPQQAATGGIHVHTGVSCAEATAVFGHYQEDLAADPWLNTVYTSDSLGAAQISISGADVSLYSHRPVLGRAIVVHDSNGNRIGCGLIGTVETLAATLGQYPGYTGLFAMGTLAVTAASGQGILMKGVLTGLEAGTSGGIHVHTGYSCSVAGDVGGHYLNSAGVDPWLSTTWTSDANGVASVYFNVSSFTLNGNDPLAGRAVVVHASSGTRISCGLLHVSPGAVTHLGVYPGYAGSETVVGTLATSQSLQPAQISTAGSVGGLPASETNGWHIHSGYSCDAAAGVGGHYFDAGTADPWIPVTYTSNAAGAADVTSAMSDYSVYASRPVLGRAMVFHSSSAKIACGLVGKAELLVASVAAYPGYTGPAPTGTLAVTDTPGGLQIMGVLTGLPASIVGGIHIHSGFSCSAAEEVGGHYFEGLATDPWTTTYASDANGHSSVAMTMPDFSISDAMPVAGRAVVLHDADGNRIGCGLLTVVPGQVTHIGRYPGYTGTQEVVGTVVAQDTVTGVLLSGTMAGLPPSTTAGFHIHSGYSCDAAEAVGGHYFEGMASDPWTTTYTSDATGAAQISLAMADFSLYSSYPVLGRAYVAHSVTAKIGCGFPGTALEKTYNPTRPPAETPTTTAGIHYFLFGSIAAAVAMIKSCF